jgi:hypothetical protein
MSVARWLTQTFVTVGAAIGVGMALGYRLTKAWTELF